MNTDHAADEAAIRRLYKAWNDAVESGDRMGYLAVLDDSVRMVPPGAADIVGRDAYAAFLIPVLENATYRIVHLGELEIDIAGDLAFTRYDYVVHITRKGGTAKITDSAAALSRDSNNCKYSDVLRRQQDGTWKVWRHMWNDGYERG